MVTIATRFLRQQLRNKSAIVMLIAVPLLLGAVLGFADQRANSAIPVGVVQEAHTVLGNDLVRALRDSAGLRVSTYASRQSLERATTRGDVWAGVVVPASYDSWVQNGGPPVIDLLGDVKRSTFTAARANTLIVVAHERLLVARALAAPGADPQHLAAALDSARAENAFTPPVERVTAEHGGHALGVGRFTAGMLVFFIFDSAMFHAAIFLDDRRRGVVARMTTTPTSRMTIVGGEIAGRAALGIVQGAIIVLAGALLFRLDWGNPVGVAAVIVLFTLVSTGIGLLISVLLRPRSVAETESATAGLIAVLGLLGGCFWPLAVVPAWLRVGSHLSPHAWANDVFDKTLATGAGIADLWLPLTVLAVFAIATFAFGVVRLRGALSQ